MSAGRLWAALSPEIREILGPEVSRLGIGQALANALGAVEEATVGFDNVPHFSGGGGEVGRGWILNEEKKEIS